MWTSLVAGLRSSVAEILSPALKLTMLCFPSIATVSVQIKRHREFRINLDAQVSVFANRGSRCPSKPAAGDMSTLCSMVSRY